MPTNTDLVKDLPADFEIFGQAVDTQMKTNADAAIAKTIVDAKGDLIAATAADTVSRIAVGTNNQVLTADSSTATGLKWATPASGLTFASATTSGEQTTSSTSYTDLSTTTSVTLTTGTKALIFINAQLRSTGNQYSYVSFAVTGASSVSASDDNAIINYGQQQNRFGCSVSLSGLTAGSNTFTLKFKSQGGETGVFVAREITVIDLGS